MRRSIIDKGVNRVVRTVKKATARALVIPAFAGVLTLTGCGSDITLTSEQNDLIAEYIGGTLMKYSNENEWKYIKLNANITNYERPSGSVSTQVPKATQAADASGQKSTQSGQSSTKASQSATTKSDATGSMSDLASALGLDGITISYTGCNVRKSYPEGSDILSVSAVSGKDILAVEFNLKNNTGSDIVCNTAQLGVIMKLSVNGASGITEYATILKNDINMLSDVTIAAGQDYQAFALFMVTEGSADNITSLSLALSGQGVDAVKIALK